MLVKARFVEELQIDEIDFRFVFLLSVDDARLLGHPVLARPGAGGIVTFGGDEPIPDADQSRLFVATMNFKPDGGEAPTAPDTIVTLRPGGFYWVMLANTLPRGIDERNAEVVQPDDGQLRGFRLARLEALGVYLAPAAAEFLGLVNLIGGALPEPPMQPALTAQALVPPEGEGLLAEALRHAPAWLFDDDPGERGAVPAGAAPQRPPDMEGDAGPAVPVPSQEMVDQFFRIAGCVLGFPLTRAFLEEGLRRYSALNGQRGTPALFELYRLWAQATRDRVERDYVDPDAPADLHTLIGEPLRQTIVDLSNPTEFGAPGAKLLLHAMLAPYSLVGPASSPGGVTLREGSGVVRLLPFWACDILAQTLYPVEPEPGAEPHATRRAQAVVSEAFFHLERRNRRAFDVLRDSGFPDRDAQPIRFDFMDLPSVSGSTVFSETVVDDAVVRRKNDLEKAVMPRLSNRFVWIADERYRTPWMALAGFLGVPLRHFGRLGGRESRSEVIGEVTAPAWHPEQVERAEPVRHNFLQLLTRAEVDREMARLVIDQAARVNEAAELNVRPPVVEGRRGAGEHRLVLSPSQAEAFRNAQRWRLSVVTGDPGTGKTTIVRELARLVREATDGEGFLLVLAPTNRAAAQLAQRLQSEVTVRLYLLGEESDEPGMPTEFDIAVGTVDSFRARMQTVENFRILMLGRPLVVAIDEASMLTMDQFAAVVDLISVSPDEAWLGQEGLTDSVLRIVLLGDPFQLPSVDPGNFLWDMMRFLPVVRLREQHRFGREAGQTGGLESFFTLIRLGMERGDARQVAVDWMLAHDREHRGNPDRFASWGLDAPDNRHGQVRVVLIDDLPQRLPGDDAGWQEFMLQLNDQVRDAVFREISDWNSDGARAESVPFIPHPASPAEREQAWRRQVLFRSDMTAPKAPFKVVTMFRRLNSESGLTHYISSAQRVNGWFHDALQGMLIGPDGQRQVAMTDLPASMVIPDLPWRDRWRELAHGNHLAQARHFAFGSRPRDLVLCPGWPYTVLRNEFRPFGIFRSETVTYTGPVQERGRQRFRFISEQGREMVISRRYARLRYLAYGWSTNVHQIQGAEYPLVVALWFEGMAFRQAQAWWQAIQPDATRGTERLDLGGDGEERMDLRAFYTAITRTRARFELVRREKQTNLKVVADSPGRCVIIAGRHALRRYLGLQVQQRATGFAGTVLDLVKAGAQEVQL